MTIGIDIRVLGNRVKSGIEEYAESLLPHLIEEGKDIQFKLFYSSRNKILPNYGWLKAPNVKLYKFGYPNNLLFSSSRFLNRPFIDKMVGGADAFFFPHFFISSLSPRCKRVTTFHDLSYLHFPEHLTFRKKMWHNLQMNPKWQAKFSDKIIAVSESTKNDLTNFYKIDPARIEVIYSGVVTSNVPWPFDVVNFKKTKNLPDRFILYLGKLEPRKNIISIIRAFNNLKTNPKYKDVGLVVAGAKGWKYNEIFELIPKDQRRSRIAPTTFQHSVECWNVVGSQIFFTGQLTDEERFLYYRAADVFVYPSFFEGFGFPPLEAMSCGTPVITSRNSSLPEVVGTAAIMVDPHDARELELWTSKLLDDGKMRDLMVKRGIERSAKFSWKKTAAKTIEVLN